MKDTTKGILLYLFSMALIASLFLLSGCTMYCEEVEVCDEYAKAPVNICDDIVYDDGFFPLTCTTTLGFVCVSTSTKQKCKF